MRLLDCERRCPPNLSLDTLRVGWALTLQHNSACTCMTGIPTVCITHRPSIHLPFNTSTCRGPKETPLSLGFSSLSKQSWSPQNMTAGADTSWLQSNLDGFQFILLPRRPPHQLSLSKRQAATRMRQSSLGSMTTLSNADMHVQIQMQVHTHADADPCPMLHGVRKV